MSRFRSRALAALDKVYGFLEGSPPQSIETDLPVTLVHDVSRTAELNALDFGPGVPGFYGTRKTNTHGAAGTILSTGNLFSALAGTIAQAIDTSTFWVWLMSVSCHTDTGGTFTSAQLSISRPQIGGAFSKMTELVALFTSEQTMAAAAGDDVTGCGQYLATVGGANVFVSPFVVPLPRLCPIGSTWNLRTVAGAASAITMELTMWVGPIGSRPSPY